MVNIYNKEYIQSKLLRRENKKIFKRSIPAEIIIFIFEKVLEGWKSIRIYNTIKQNDSKIIIDKKKVENICTGNCKIFENELSIERYNYYTDLRIKVYEFNSKK